MTLLPRTISVGVDPGGSRFGINAVSMLNYHRSLTFILQRYIVNLASSRKWDTKLLRFNDKSEPESPRS
jgi:hypothetical protein